VTILNKTLVTDIKTHYIYILAKKSIIKVSAHLLLPLESEISTNRILLKTANIDI